MQISELLRRPGPHLSIELFPPKTEKGKENLKTRLNQFKTFSPDFMSVTYGAGGSTRSGTLELSTYVQKQLSVPAMAHLTCVNHSKSDISAVADEIKSAGISNIMALRGDPPAGEKTYPKTENGFNFSSELISFLKSKGGLSIGAACYPEGHVEAATFEKDLDAVKAKIDAGADFLVTQFFLDNQYFFRFRDILASKQISIPLLPGILPISNYAQITKFSIPCGCTIPARVMKGLNGRSDEDQEKFGLDHAASQIEELLNSNVDGVHLYALNKQHAVERLAPIVRNSKLAKE